MRTLNGYVTIHLLLISIDMLEVAILLMSYLIEYVFQLKQKTLTYFFLNMITGINESKTLTKHISCKWSLTVENVTQIKNGGTINVGVTTKWKKYILQNGK